MPGAGPWRWAWFVSPPSGPVLRLCGAIGGRGRCRYGPEAGTRQGGRQGAKTGRGEFGKENTGQQAGKETTMRTIQDKIAARVEQYNTMQRILHREKGKRPLDASQAFTLRELAAFGETFGKGTPEDRRDMVLCGMLMCNAAALDGYAHFSPVMQWAIEKHLKGGRKDGKIDRNALVFRSLKTGRKLTCREMHRMFRRRCEAAKIRVGSRDIDTFVETGVRMGIEVISTVPDKGGEFEEFMEDVRAVWDKRVDTALKVLFGLVDVEDAEREWGV